MSIESILFVYLRVSQRKHFQLLCFYFAIIVSRHLGILCLLLESIITKWKEFKATKKKL